MTDTYKGYDSGDLPEEDYDFDSISDWLVGEDQFLMGESISNIKDCYDQGSKEVRQAINFLLTEMFGWQIQGILNKGR